MMSGCRSGKDTDCDGGRLLGTQLLDVTNSTSHYIVTFRFLNQDVNTVLSETTDFNSGFISVRMYFWQARLNGRNHIKRLFEMNISFVLLYLFCRIQEHCQP